MRSVLLAIALIFILAAPASAGVFCPDYGIRCYKHYPENRPVTFQNVMSWFLTADGDYMGSFYLDEGQCGPPCQTCDESLRDVDWDAMCNRLFEECENNCFHD